SLWKSCAVSGGGGRRRRHWTVNGMRSTRPGARAVENRAGITAVPPRSERTGALVEHGQALQAAQRAAAVAGQVGFVLHVEPVRRAGEDCAAPARARDRTRRERRREL